jgi:hypothetical protein
MQTTPPPPPSTPPPSPLQALILLRLWVISEDIYDRANVGVSSAAGSVAGGGVGGVVSSSRNRSYATNLAALAPDDVDDLQKSIARTLLESTNLPAAAAIWPTRDVTFRGLKLVLDVATASTHVSYRASRAMSALPSWLVSIVNAPLSAAALAWYGLQPRLAAERTAAIVHRGDVAFFIALWRLTDTRAWLLIAEEGGRVGGGGRTRSSHRCMRGLRPANLDLPRPRV